jgi:hypothetical protein
MTTDHSSAEGEGHTIDAERTRKIVAPRTFFSITPVYRAVFKFDTREAR